MSAKELRERLGLDRKDFAQLTGVDLRTVTRWEDGSATPTGPSKHVIAAIEEKLRRDPVRADETIAFIAGAVRFGGLGFLILSLLDAALATWPSEGRSTLPNAR